MNNLPKPLITTIIPTYCRPNLLCRAIKSVLNQTYPNFQACIYDNASGDETAQIVAELAKRDERVKYFCHSKNIGGLANVNYAMEHIDTDFFSILSDDDILLPEFYDAALEGFIKYPEVFFSSTLTLFDARSNICRPYGANWIPGVYKPPDGLLTILRNGPPTWTGTLFRREAIAKVGLLDNQVSSPSDLDFQLRIAAHFPYVISLKPGAVYMFHALSYSAQQSLSDIWPGWLKMINNLTQDKKIPFNLRACASDILTNKIQIVLSNMAWRSILQKDFEQAQRVADIFRAHYNLNRKAAFFYIIVKICKHSSFIYNLALFLNMIRKCLLKNKSLFLQKKDTNPLILAYVNKMKNDQSND